MLALVQSVPAVLQQVESQLPADFSDAVWQPISQGMRSQCDRFDAGLSTLKATDPT